MNIKHCSYTSELCVMCIVFQVNENKQLQIKSNQITSNISNIQESLDGEMKDPGIMPKQKLARDRDSIKLAIKVINILVMTRTGAYIF